MISGYSDNIEIIGRSKQNVTAAKMGLAANKGKTKHILSTSTDMRRIEGFQFAVFDCEQVCLPWLGRYQQT